VSEEKKPPSTESFAKVKKSSSTEGAPKGKKSPGAARAPKEEKIPITEIVVDEVELPVAEVVADEVELPVAEIVADELELPVAEVVADEVELPAVDNVQEEIALSDELPETKPSVQKVFDGRKVLLYFGEVAITLGLILALFVGYKAFLQDSVVADTQTQKAQQFGNGSDAHKFRDPAKVNSQAQIFGRMYVPRFGEKWTRLVAEGTRWHPVLNEIGIGHYIGTAMPGNKGNFAVAAHRGGFGGAFKEIHRLVAGDKVYVETRNFWYVYKYMQTKIVDPKDTDVVRAVPKELVGAKAGGRYMTMTSCTPIFVNTQRIIVWLELEKKIAVRNGAPKELKLGGK
jgi:sortase A